MLNFEIHPAAAYSAETLREVMVDAFSDYAIPLRLDQQGFDAMMRQRGLDMGSSRVALVDGEFAAIWLTSVRDGCGYLISSGTRPAYRSRGLARQMGDASLRHMRDAGVRSFQTEVLRDNATALGLYLSLGMAKRRELDCYSIPGADRQEDDHHEFQQVDWKQIANQAAGVREWAPSWQNSDQSLAAIADLLQCTALFDGSDLVAFAAINPKSGVLHQLAVRADRRRSGVALALLKELQIQAPDTGLRLINVWAGDDAARALMRRVGATETPGQFELHMPL